MYACDLRVSEIVACDTIFNFISEYSSLELSPSVHVYQSKHISIKEEFWLIMDDHELAGFLWSLG